MKGLDYKWVKSAAVPLYTLLMLLWIGVCVAQFGGGSGTVEDPWQIGRVYHLNEIREYLGPQHFDKFYVQTGDINLGLAPWNEGEGWEPLGFSEIVAFQGNYDGRGYTINGLTIYRPYSDYQGLFGYTSGATISNVVLRNVNVVGKEGIGGLVGWGYGSTINHCSTTGIVSGVTNIGGLLGHSGVHSEVNNSYSHCRVSGTDARAAGLVGYNQYYAYINNCFSTGEVSGNRQIGGLVGRNALATVTNSYSTSTVNARTMVGGLVGINAVTASISNSYSTGMVRGYSAFGGFVGTNENSNVYNCYWNTNSSVNHSPAGMGRTTDQMTYPYSGNTFTGWDFNTIWAADTHYRVNNGYPYLRWQFNDYPDVAVNPEPPDGAIDISVSLAQLEWDFIADTLFVNPSGFRVYLNETGQFDENDEFTWVPYFEEEERYFCQEVITELNYGTTYYWMVVPTTNEVISNKRDKNRRNTHKSHYRRTRDVPNIRDAKDCPVWSFTTEIGTSVDEKESAFPTELKNNYPNPANPSTAIEYSLEIESSLTLQVYNIRGQLIKTLANGVFRPGKYRYIWDGTNDNNQQVASGIYFYRLKTDSYDRSRKMVLIR